MIVKIVVPIDPTLVIDALTGGISTVDLGIVHHCHADFAHESSASTGSCLLDPRDRWEYLEYVLDLFTNSHMDTSHLENNPRFHDYVFQTADRSLGMLDRTLLRYGEHVPWGIGFSGGLIHSAQPYLVYGIHTFKMGKTP